MPKIRKGNQRVFSNILKSLNSEGGLGGKREANAKSIQRLAATKNPIIYFGDKNKVHMWMTFLLHAKNRQSNVYASFPFYIRFYTFEGYVSEKHTFFFQKFHSIS